jgi:hypothetical protein
MALQNAQNLDMISHLWLRQHRILDDRLASHLARGVQAEVHVSKAMVSVAAVPEQHVHQEVSQG